MSSLQLRKDRLIIQIDTGPETQWMCTQQCLKHHYVLLDCLLISVLDVSAAFVSLLGTMYGPSRSAVDYAVKGGQTHFNPHGRVHACTHRRAHTHTHTHTNKSNPSSVSHYKAMCPSSIHKQRSEYSDLFVSDWPRGTSASFLWDDMFAAALFVRMFWGNIIGALPRARSMKLDRDKHGSRRTDKRDRHGGTGTDLIRLSRCVPARPVFAVNRSAAISQCPLCHQALFFLSPPLPSQTLGAEQRSSVTSTAEERWWVTRAVIGNHTCAQTHTVEPIQGQLLQRRHGV